MDLLGARAIPALIAALASGAAAAAGPGCAALDGSYRYEGVAGKGEARTLGEFASAAEARKLYPASPPGTRAPILKLTGNGVIRQAAAQKPLASRVSLAHDAGSTRLTYLDERGRTLVVSRLEASGEWRCEGTRLARTWERTAGLGDAIRTERVLETLERDAAGRLVHRESVTVIEGGGRGRLEETRFEPAR